MYKRTSNIIACVAFTGLTVAVQAQQSLNVAGTQHLYYVGQQVQDFTVPDQIGAQLLLSVAGGDGGGASWHGLLYGEAVGGKGATTDIVCRVGMAAGELAPGGTVRFIIGNKGQTEPLCNPTPFDPCQWAGGGGSGSGILYLAPEQADWNKSVVLAAAGGGGGGATDSGFNVIDNGNDATINNNCGGDGGAADGNDGHGGCGGAGGQGWWQEDVSGAESESGGGGGGAFGAATDGRGNPSEDQGGLAGFPSGNTVVDSRYYPEGWGFGAGGARSYGGGGGGGYSGGGAGNGYGRNGGGGGGFVNTTYALDSAMVAGTEYDGDAGFGEYYFLRPANDTPQDAIAFTIGQTLSGTTASGDTQFTLDCDPAGPVCDVWYSYTNTDADCIDRVTFTWSTPNTSVSIHDPDSIFTPLECSDSGTLVAEILPGDTIWVRVINPLAPYSIATSGGVVDTDGDGVCDSLDDCPSGNDSIDCNDNGVPDCAEDIAHSRTIGQNFDTTGHPYQLRGGAFVDSGQARLVTGSTTPVGTLFFDPLDPYDSVAEFVADFDFRIGTNPGQINEGLAFAMLSQSDFSTWSTDANYGESLTELGDVDRELTVDFDTSGGSNNVIIRRSGSFVPRTVSPSFDLDNAQLHHAKITWADHVITVELTPNGGSPEVVYTEQVGAPLYLSPSVFAFGAGRANPSQNGNTWIDNVRITDLSNDDDCDGDGLPDACDTLGCVTPTNDECSGAIAISPGDVAFDISNATGTAIGSCSSSDPQDIWYSVTPDCTEPVRIETIHVPQQNGLLFFPTLGIYDTCGGTELACAVNNTPGTADEQAVIDTTVTEGVPVLIRVAGWLYGRGPGILRISPLNDSDGDGVGDACDTCPGFDDSIDSDGDGIPDGCDTCDNTIDCDENLIADCEDLAHPGRFENFGGGGQRAYTLADFSLVTEGAAQLTTGPFQDGGVSLAPVGDQAVESFEASFDFRITNTGLERGISFVAFNADVYGQAAGWSEDGLAIDALTVSFDTSDGGPPEPPGGNFVEIRNNGVIIDQQIPSFTMRSDEWHHAEITFVNGTLTLVLTPSGGSPETVFNAVPVPGFTPYVAGYGFGARTGSLGGEHYVDNIRFIDTSHGNDDDGDGIINACDICPGFNDAIDNDGDQIPDGCDGCPGGDNNLDADGDQVPDGCDLCPNTIPGAPINVDGCPDPAIPADIDNDGDVDADDFALFVTCASGPDVPVTGGCENGNLDNDGDIDLYDFSVLQHCYSGESIPGDPNCAD